MCEEYGYSEADEEKSKSNTSSSTRMDGVTDGDTKDQRQQVRSSPDAISLPAKEADDVLVAVDHGGAHELAHNDPDEGEVVEPRVKSVQEVVAEFRAED